ncbi:MAG TPA: 7-carboxy-7-deazaguanine synthase QueE [Nitrosospira sp.]
MTRTSSPVAPAAPASPAPPGHVQSSRVEKEGKAEKVEKAENLRISEIFFSLQGETSRVGLPTVFVRLTGCPLRCGYCDTEYAFYGGRRLSIAAILAEVGNFAARYVTVTGGEPLAQKECLTLLRELCDTGYSVSLETSGALDVSSVDARVSKILDIKTPGSGEVKKNRWSNLRHLTQHDEVKFVLCDEADYQWAVEAIRERQLARICAILFSPVHGRLDPAALAAWVLRDNLPVRVQVQLHKLLWGEGPGR